MASKLKASFRGNVQELPICYSEEAAATVASRWPDGVVVLEDIYEMESSSTLEERSLIVKRTLDRIGIKLRLDPKKSTAIAIRDAFKAFVSEQQPNA